jgi:hypothetical protein
MSLTLDTERGERMDSAVLFFSHFLAPTRREGAHAHGASHLIRHDEAVVTVQLHAHLTEQMTRHRLQPVGLQGVDGGLQPDLVHNEPATESRRFPQIDGVAEATACSSQVLKKRQGVWMPCERIVTTAMESGCRVRGSVLSVQGL